MVWSKFEKLKKIKGVSVVVVIEMFLMNVIVVLELVSGKFIVIMELV